MKLSNNKIEFKINRFINITNLSNIVSNVDIKNNKKYLFFFILIGYLYGKKNSAGPGTSPFQNLTIYL